MSKTPIMGESAATAQQMADYLLSVNPAPKINIPVLTLTQMYVFLGALEGVRGDLEFARSCHETGNFSFPGTVIPEQNNYCGHGTVSATEKGSFFPDEATGILVQIQHAKAYATTDPLNYECLDDRYKYVQLGCAPTMEETSGRWAVPGYETEKYKSLQEAMDAGDSYGHKIVKILNKILAMPTGKEEKTEGGNSPLVDYVKISPNSNNPRNMDIRKITIHHCADVTSVENLGDWFARPDVKGSSNYGVDSNGRVGMYVEEKNRAWTSGSPNNDNQAVTIEVSNDVEGGDWHVSDKALEKTIELCVDICKRNDIERLNFTGDASGNLTMHKYFQNTNCPGPYLERNFPYIAEEVNKRLGVPSYVPQEKELYRVQAGAFGSSVKANEHKDRIIKAGFEAFVRFEDNFYKIQAGAFETNEGAEKRVKDLESAGFESFIK